MKHFDYLILGGGHAGVTAAFSIRETDSCGSIMILEAGPVLSCKRPLLSKSPLMGWRDANFIEFGEKEYLDHHILHNTNCRIEALDLADRSVCTSDGTYSYGRCIYALGGMNFIPPFSGSSLPGVFTVRNSSDIHQLKRLALKDDRGIIIGGGVIGIEMAAEMRKYGMDVTLLEALPRLMPRQLDEDCARYYTSLFSDIRIETGVTIEKICGGKHAEGVLLADGRFFPGSIVFVSCGQRPCTAAAEKAGLLCERGVVVDERMRTSDPNVYACGDCAQWNGINAALWSQAGAEGIVAGINAAGGDRKMTGFDMSLVINCGERSLFAAGDPGNAADERYRFETILTDKKSFSINERPQKAMEKRVYKDGKLVGGCIMGSLAGMKKMKEELSEAANG